MLLINKTQINQVLLHTNLNLKMSAVAKSQHKNNVATKLATIGVPAFTAYTSKTAFITEMNALIFQCESTEGQENKMKVVLKIYEKLNENLSSRIAEDGLDCWITVIATVYLKSSEFIREMDNGEYFAINTNVVKRFCSYVFQVRNFISNIIKNYGGNKSHPSITRAKEEIARLESVRPRRSILRVNYTGMATN